MADGTEGVVLVADWQDPVVGGHAMRSPNGYGRILRIAAKGSKARAPKIVLGTLAGQIEVLNSPAIKVRFAAQEKLLANNAAARPLLEELRRSENAILNPSAVIAAGYELRMMLESSS